MGLAAGFHRGFGNAKAASDRKMLITIPIINFIIAPGDGFGARRPYKQDYPGEPNPLFVSLDRRRSSSWGEQDAFHPLWLNYRAFELFNISLRGPSSAHPGRATCRRNFRTWTAILGVVELTFERRNSPQIASTLRLLRGPFAIAQWLVREVAGSCLPPNEGTEGIRCRFAAEQLFSLSVTILSGVACSPFRSLRKNRAAARALRHFCTRVSVVEPDGVADDFDRKSVATDVCRVAARTRCSRLGHSLRAGSQSTRGNRNQPSASPR
jgi:hypothetical protein